MRDPALLTLLTAWYLQVPIIIGGVLHMVVVTKDWWPALKVPLHEGLFGRNKTWRGILIMPLFTAFGALCLQPVETALGDQALLGPWPVLTGAIAGLGYVLAELPNSYFKRRMGIPPGGLPTQHKGLFIMLDQFDSGLGVILAYALYLNTSWPVCLTYLVTFPVTALVVKRLLFMAKLKKSAV